MDGRICSSLPRSPPQRLPQPLPLPRPPTPSPAMFVVRDADTTDLHLRHLPRARRQVATGSTTRSRTPSSNRTSWCSKRSFPKQPRSRGSGSPLAGFARRRSPRRPRSLRPPGMAINAGRSQGMQVDNGADMVLRHIAEAEGKPVEGLETLQLQIDMFNRMPPASAAAAAAAARGQQSRNARWTACRRRWPKCRRPGSAATRACSCACSTSSKAPRPTPTG